MGGDNVLGVVIAVLGTIGAVVAARVSVPRPAPAVAGAPVDPADDRATVLEVSPEIFTHFSGRIRGLENKVDHLTELVEAQTIRVTTLEKLLRQSMRLLRRAHQQLRIKGSEPDPVPPELIPYSID